MSSNQQSILRAEFVEALERGSHMFFYSCDWHALVADLCGGEGTDAQREAFATQWVTHGAKIREQTADDTLLVQTLRKWLPLFHGDGLILYRGESAERMTRKQYGLCWTTKIEVATMFAAGLNAVLPDGGVLLRAYASSEAVISGPGRHSAYLGEAEHTVDPADLIHMEVLNRFPPADRPQAAA